MEKSKVYYCDMHTGRMNLPEKLKYLMKKAGFENIDFEDKYTAVKIHFGEPGNLAYLRPNWAKVVCDYVKELDGKAFLTDCNTLYVGGRKNALDHLDSAYTNGYNPFQTGVHTIIADGLKGTDEALVPVNGEYVKEAKIGQAIMDADIIISLNHFKGHELTGFGGALKNMSIGIASSNGKANIHTAGVTTDPKKLWDNLPEQDHFLESMADACKGVIDYMGKDNIVYINVANNLSVDCDCDSHPAPPEMADIGIFASIDPVALDQACYDAVINSPDDGKAALIERMDSRHGIHTVEAAAKLQLGNREYEIINID